jgi:hypothetical protein
MSVIGMLQQPGAIRLVSRHSVPKPRANGEASYGVISNTVPKVFWPAEAGQPSGRASVHF